MFISTNYVSNMHKEKYFLNLVNPNNWILSFAYIYIYCIYVCKTIYIICMHNILCIMIYALRVYICIYTYIYIYTSRKINVQIISRVSSFESGHIKKNHPAHKYSLCMQENGFQTNWKNKSENQRITYYFSAPRGTN